VNPSADTPAELAVVDPDGAALLAHVEASPRPDRNPFLVYLGSLRGDGPRVMRQALGEVARLVAGPTADPETFPWWRLRYSHIERIRALLAERYAPATANRALTATRQVMLRCRRLGLMSGEDYIAAKDVAPVRGERLPAGRALEPGELARLCAACDERAGTAARDYAVAMSLAHGGLRREEVVLLDAASYDAARATLIVLGKNNKQREVPVTTALAGALDAWMRVRGTAAGPLFHPLTRVGRVLRERRLSHQAVYAILAKLAERAGVIDVSPHDFRRTFISELLDRGADIATVAKLAGHEQIETTQRYDRRGERAKRRAVDLLDAPPAPDGGNR
jgi:integrase